MALTPVKAIRAKCLDCSAESTKEVRNCPMKDCPLYPFRMGTNPNRKGRKLSDKEKSRLTKQLEQARAAKSS